MTSSTLRRVCCALFLGLGRCSSLAPVAVGEAGGAASVTAIPPRKLRVPRTNLEGSRSLNTLAESARKLSATILREGRKTAEAVTDTVSDVLDGSDGHLLELAKEGLQAARELQDVRESQSHKTAMQDARADLRLQHSQSRLDETLAQEDWQTSKARMRNAKKISDAIARETKRTASEVVRAKRFGTDSALKYNMAMEKAALETQMAMAKEAYLNTQGAARTAELKVAWAKTAHVKQVQELMNQAASSPYAKPAAEAVAKAYGEQLARQGQR